MLNLPEVFGQIESPAVHRSIGQRVVQLYVRVDKVHLDQDVFCGGMREPRNTVMVSAGTIAIYAMGQRECAVPERI